MVIFMSIYSESLEGQGNHFVVDFICAYSYKIDNELFRQSNRYAIMSFNQLIIR
jgi:hypothetical protein